MSTPVKLSAIPIDVKNCLRGKVQLPKGDWDDSVVLDLIDKYQLREDKLEGCLVDVVNWYQSYRRRLDAKVK